MNDHADHQRVNGHADHQRVNDHADHQRVNDHADLKKSKEGFENDYTVVNAGKGDELVIIITSSVHSPT